MDIKKLKLYWTVYKVRIIIIAIALILVIGLIFIIINGIQAWVTMESFYKKSMQAQMAFGLYAGIYQALIFASIYMGFHYYFFFGGGLNKIGRKKTTPEKVNVKWSDVIGMESIKKEVWEVIQLIKDRAQLKKAGGRIIKGVLMVGPPGCGKTYLGKAIATETGLPFLHTVGSEYQGMFQGMGSSRIRSVFKEARALSTVHGGCIIFIDEIDSIARPRVGDTGFGSGLDYNATVNQLLTEMDGLTQRQENIVVMAATNVPEDQLDSALMRAGRFDRKIYLGLPDLNERKELLKYYLNQIDYDKEKIDFTKLAKITVGNSPADISNIVREASLIAIRKKKTNVDMSDLHDAKERITLGVKAEIALSEKDKIIAAYHESGHVIATYLLVPTQDVFKASIIPRKETGGVTWIMEKEERFIPDKEELLGKIKISLGGYSAEKIQFGVTSTGVEMDLKRVNELAEKMVTQWGMGTSGPTSISSNPWMRRDVSERDKEDIIMNCLNEVNEVIRKEKALLDDLASELLKKEELEFDELEAIFLRHGKTALTYAPKETAKDKSGVTWDDVIGMEEAKQEAKEIVQLIKDRVALQQVGGQIIRGLLLFGPPGCGKTYLASAIANEAGVPFIAKSGSEFVEMYVGVGASRIRHLFQEAREKALAKGGCIIFIDELDAVAGKRGGRAEGGDREYNQTLNQLLVELDGLKEKDVQYNIVIIGATNMLEDFMDPALLRPGRFDRKIYVELPTWEDRKKLFAYYFNQVKFNPQEIDFDKLASITTGWSPAEISNLIREAALLAVRNSKDMIGLKEIEESRERIELGLKRRIKLSDEEKKATAYHEAGHAIATHFFAPTKQLFKVSIIPRKETGGVAWTPERQESLNRDKNQILANIKIALGGYVAEKLRCPATSAGVDSDFSSALQQANAMVWRWGMGKSGLIGNFSAISKDLISEEMKRKLDVETQDILQECLKDTENLLKREIQLLDELTNELLKKEELNYNELEEFFKKYAKGKPEESAS